MLSFHVSDPNTTPNYAVADGWQVYSGNDPEELRKIFTMKRWSPIIWHGGTRNSASFKTSHYLALDFDSGSSLAEVKKDFADCWHILGTTKNHLKDKGGVTCERFRLLLKWQRPIRNLDEHRFNTGNWIKDLKADPSGKDGARMFMPCTEIVSMRNDGSVIEVEDYQEELKRRQEAIERAQKAAAKRLSYGRLGRFAEQWLTHVIPQGQRNDTCFALGCDLRRAGITYEDAVRRILASPTYAGGASAEVVKEIRDVVRSAYNRA